MGTGPRALPQDRRSGPGTRTAAGPRSPDREEVQDSRGLSRSEAPGSGVHRGRPCKLFRSATKTRCRSSTRLWRELRKLGFRGPGEQRALLAPAAPELPDQSCKSTPTPGSVYRKSPETGRIAELAKDCFRIFRERNLEALPAWLHAARGTALESFAARLERDIDAVREALRLPWSQGPVEGRYTGLSSSNARCRAEPASSCCASAS